MKNINIPIVYRIVLIKSFSKPLINEYKKKNIDIIKLVVAKGSFKDDDIINESNIKQKPVIDTCILDKYDDNVLTSKSTLP